MTDLIRIGATPDHVHVKVAAATKINDSEMFVKEGGVAVAASAATAAGTDCMIANATADNTSGIAGDVRVQGSYGCYERKIDAGAGAFTDADCPVKVYVLDAWTVTITATANAVAGIAYQVMDDNGNACVRFSPEGQVL